MSAGALRCPAILYARVERPVDANAGVPTTIAPTAGLISMGNVNPLPVTVCVVVAVPIAVPVAIGF